MNILIVDDDKEMTAALESLLKKEGFSVDSASDGESGSFKARTNGYDLIILDNVMPKKGGKGVCREIRDKGINSPVIILSAVSEIDKKVDLLDAGADDYITKPFQFKELLARIKALLRRPKEIEKDIIVIGDLTIDRVRQMVFRGKKEVVLTSKEFRLLEYFVRNKGLILSRGTLMEHVWDVDADPFSNTIETHILTLRKKIGDDEDKNLIRTVTGKGYKIDWSK